MMNFSATVLSLLSITSDTPRLPQLVKVFPAEESTQTCAQPIGARLNFRLGKEVEPSSVQLFVNGIDVTKKARITGTRDVPQSHYRIAFTPAICQPGTYGAEIRFRLIDGTTESYKWSFAITTPD